MSADLTDFTPDPDRAGTVATAAAAIAAMTVPAGMMRVCVKTQTGKDITLTFEMHTTVARIKELLQESESIPVHQQRLVYVDRNAASPQPGAHEPAPAIFRAGEPMLPSGLVELADARTVASYGFAVQPRACIFSPSSGRSSGRAFEASPSSCDVWRRLASDSTNCCSSRGSDTPSASKVWQLSRA